MAHLNWNGNRYTDAGGYWTRYARTAEGKTMTIYLHREVMAKKLGRPLHPNEVVHHKDEDKKNNDPENLELKTRRTHGQEHAKPPELVTFICPMCGVEATKLAREVRGNRKKGRPGPFCGRSCSGRFNQKKTNYSRVERKGGGRPRKTGWTDEQALELLTQGMSIRATAKALGASTYAVQQVKKKAGMTER